MDTFINQIGTQKDTFRLNKNKHYVDSSSGLNFGKLVSLVKNKLMGVNDSGVFSVPNQSYTEVRKITTTQAISNTTWTKVTFNSVIHNTQNEWNSTNNRFIASSAGVYNVSAFLEYAQNNNRSRAIQLYVNGVATGKTICLMAANNTVSNIGISTPIKLNANDYVEIYTYQNGAATLNLNPNNCYFTVTKLS